MKKIMIYILLQVITVVTYAQVKTYSNPILAGFYPDPSICRAGDDYYLVNSSFAYFPGLPLFHSTDLVNWKQIGHALERPEQLDLDGAGVSRGLFAPSISYHKGVFYIVCTLIDKTGNFVITSHNPKGPWSNPVPIPEVNGIDPSLFFEGEEAYIVYNSIPPDNISLHQGHRTIRMIEFDYHELKVKGAEMLLINGGTDMAKKPVWIEAPHIFKKDGWYFLICAEGGTAYQHSEVVFRSKMVQGPYIPFEKNPILTQRHLDPSRKNPVTTAGHADFVETSDGRWFAVFLACRPYEGEHYNLGRETFMAPVKWEDGWPFILKGNEEVAARYPVPMPDITKEVLNPFSGSFSFKDDFNDSLLNQRFVLLRTPGSSWYNLSEKKGSLSVQLLPNTCSGTKYAAFAGFRQSHMDCEASTILQFKAKGPNEKAGLMIFQSEHHFYFLCLSINNGVKQVQLFKSTQTDSLSLLSAAPLDSDKEVQLKITSSGNTYSFYYASQKGEWKLLKDRVGARFLSTKTAGGFVGCLYALYASSYGQPTSSKAFFNRFVYKGGSVN